MRRRSLLAAITAGSLGTSGCFSPFMNDCPDPEFEEEIEYESNNPENLFESSSNGSVLIRRKEDINRFDSPNFSEEDKQWVENTDFDNTWVIGIQVSSSSSSSDFELLGIERKNEDDITAHTCLPTVDNSKVLVHYTRLLRIPHQDKIPRAIRVKHWEEGEKVVYEGLEG